MADTTIDLTIGINLQIGSVPVALSAEVEYGTDQTVYTFTGCVQDAVVDIGTFVSYVGQQFGVEVLLPPELDLEADIDYVAGQLIYTSPTTGNATTEVSISGKFDLIYNNGEKEEKFSFNFYADSIITSGSDVTTYVVGASLDTNLDFADLPLVGSIPVFNDFVLQHVGFSYTNADTANNGGKAITFNIPKVSTSANPLYTRTNPDGNLSKNYTVDSSGDQTTFSLTQKGFALTVGLMVKDSDITQGNFALPMALPETTAPTTPATYYQGSGSVNSSPADSPVHWIDINKTYGPVNLQKIGLNYKSGEATFALSAGFSMSGFSLSLQNLSITFPLPLPGMPAGDTVSFGLDGLSMDVQQGNVTIGGAFLKTVVDDTTNYFGEAVVQAGNYGFTAIGGYAPAQDGNPASFFIYANLEGPLGGPPFLYISGLAFGFGVNYSLNLPTLSNLSGYLLLPGNAPAQPSTASNAFKTVLTQLSSGTYPVVTNEPGEYWVAAGVQFTSFNMVSAFALVSVSFGVEVQVGMVGSCSITLPTGSADPLAYIEIDMVGSFTPSTGLFSMSGVVSPASYIFGDYVTISGSFAFYIWFSGEHKGDFVTTLGGYNSSFTKPSWYPTVSRLTLGFTLGAFQASGSAYLAFTPAMFMAGMQFTASWSAGSVKAWFTTGADFLISWAPFYYEADAYINVGCSVDMGLFTVHVSAGADLKLWGAPFGGEAKVDLDIVSFTISFGSSAVNAPPVTWQNLQDNFLPSASSSTQSLKARSGRMANLMRAASNVTADDSTSNVTASVQTGLLAQEVTDAEGRTWDWIVDPDDFLIVTATSIPANTAKWATGANTTSDIPNVLADYDSTTVDASEIPYLSLVDADEHYSETQVWNPVLGVKPMNLSNVTSVHTITLQKADENGAFTGYLTEVEIQPILGSSNTALWGNSSSTSVNSASLLSDTLLGFNILPLPRNPDTVNNVPLYQLLFTQGNETTFSYTSHQSDDSYTVTSSVTAPDYDLDIEVTGAATESYVNEDYILSTLTADWVTTQRSTILDAIIAAGFSTLSPSEVDLTAMATTEELTDWPMVGILGNTIPA